MAAIGVFTFVVLFFWAKEGMHNEAAIKQVIIVSRFIFYSYSILNAKCFSS